MSNSEVSESLTQLASSISTHIQLANLCRELSFFLVVFLFAFFVLKFFVTYEHKKQICLQQSLTSCMQALQSQQELFLEKLKQIVRLCSNSSTNRILNRKTELYRSLVERLVQDMRRDGMDVAYSNSRKHKVRRVTFNPCIDIRYISNTGINRRPSASPRANLFRRKRTKNSLITPNYSDMQLRAGMKTAPKTEFVAL